MSLTRSFLNRVRSNDLEKSHKYTRREKKNGKWVYYYDEILSAHSTRTNTARHHVEQSTLETQEHPQSSVGTFRKPADRNDDDHVYEFDAPHLSENGNLWLSKKTNKWQWQLGDEHGIGIDRDGAADAISRAAAARPVEIKTKKAPSATPKKSEWPESNVGTFHKVGKNEYHLRANLPGGDTGKLWGSPGAWYWALNSQSAMEPLKNRQDAIDALDVVVSATLAKEARFSRNK